MPFRVRSVAHEMFIDGPAERRSPLNVVVSVGAVVGQAKLFVEFRAPTVVLEHEMHASPTVVAMHDDLFSRFGAVTDERDVAERFRGAGGQGAQPGACEQHGGEPSRGLGTDIGVLQIK